MQGISFDEAVNKALSILSSCEDEGTHAVVYAILALAMAVRKAEPAAGADSEKSDLMNTPIDCVTLPDKRLTTRFHNCMACANVITVRDLIRLSRIYLLRLPHLGPKTLLDIEAWLAERGLFLGAQ